MPYKSEKLIKLEGTSKDRRRKLLDEKKDEICSLKGQIGRNECARLFNVSRRTVDFLWHPEKLQKNKQLRQERGGWKHYYSKDQHKESMKNWRHYKQEIYLEEVLK